MYLNEYHLWLKIMMAGGDGASSSAKEEEEEGQVCCRAVKVERLSCVFERGDEDGPSTPMLLSRLDPEVRDDKELRNKCNFVQVLVIFLVPDIAEVQPGGDRQLRAGQHGEAREDFVPYRRSFDLLFFLLFARRSAASET